LREVKKALFKKSPMDSGFTHGWNRPIWPAGLTLSDEFVALYVLNGLAVGPISPIASTVEQEITPVEMRSRCLEPPRQLIWRVFFWVVLWVDI
jgi:hypothetical protein